MINEAYILCLYVKSDAYPPVRNNNENSHNFTFS